MQELVCTVCGGNLHEINAGKNYKCMSCNTQFSRDFYESQIDAMRALLDEQKQEQVKNLRQNL